MQEIFSNCIRYFFKFQAYTISSLASRHLLFLWNLKKKMYFYEISSIRIWIPEHFSNILSMYYWWIEIYNDNNYIFPFIVEADVWKKLIYTSVISYLSRKVHGCILLKNQCPGNEVTWNIIWLIWCAFIVFYKKEK